MALHISLYSHPVTYIHYCYFINIFLAILRDMDMYFKYIKSLNVVEKSFLPVNEMSQISFSHVLFKNKIYDLMTFIELNILIDIYSCFNKNFLWYLLRP